MDTAQHMFDILESFAAVEDKLCGNSPSGETVLLRWNLAMGELQSIFEDPVQWDGWGGGGERTVEPADVYDVEVLLLFDINATALIDIYEQMATARGIEIELTIPTTLDPILAN